MDHTRLHGPIGIARGMYLFLHRDLQILVPVQAPIIFVGLVKNDSVKRYGTLPDDAPGKKQQVFGPGQIFNEIETR